MVRPTRGGGGSNGRNRRDIQSMSLHGQDGGAVADMPMHDLGLDRNDGGRHWRPLSLHFATPSRTVRSARWRRGGRRPFRTMVATRPIRSPQNAPPMPSSLM